MPDLMHALSSTCYIYKLFNLLEVKEIYINSFFGGKCVKAAHPPSRGLSLSPPLPFLLNNQSLTLTLLPYLQLFTQFKTQSVEICAKFNNNR